MKYRQATRTFLCSTVFAAMLSVSTRAHAQLFSNHDGYADDGKYQIQVELTPYIWLPAVAGSIHFASPRVGSRDFNSGFPTAAELKNSLHAAFMGAGVMRYGPWSAEVDIQYVDVGSSSTLATGRFGRVYRVNVSADYVRVAPGFGYRVYSGDVAGLPTSVDARVGFAYFNTSQGLSGEAALDRVEDRNDSSSFVQPWVGGRVTFVPTPRWRVEVAALVQGLGVENSWGWGASVIGAYALTRWADLNLGFRAIRSTRDDGSTDLPGADSRSFSAVAYGPVLGVGFRF
jgi:hypothetical protein